MVTFGQAAVDGSVATGLIANHGFTAVLKRHLSSTVVVPEWSSTVALFHIVDSLSDFHPPHESKLSMISPVAVIGLGVLWSAFGGGWKT